MEVNVARAERTLSLLTNTYLANADTVKTSAALVLDTILSQNLFVYLDASSGASAETTKRYESAIHKWIARVSSLLAGKTSESRLAGILLAKHTTLQAPAMFVEQAGKWTTALLNMLGKADVAAVHVGALQLLQVFMDVVREVPELHREIATAQVPRMNQAVVALGEKSAELVDAALELLMCSASWFPTLFRPSIDKTEALCLRVLLSGGSGGSGTSGRAARCLAGLALVGGKVTVEERWFAYAQQTVGTIDACIDHVTCADAPPARATLAGMAEFASDFMVSFPQAADRITAMGDVAVALLTRPVGVDVPIPVDALVGVASRLALVPVRVAASKSSRAEFGVVPLLAPQLQRAAMRILAALCVAVDGHMQPFLAQVARAMAALSTRLVASATTQVALYALLRLYVERFGCGFVVCLPADLIAAVISDISVQSRRQASATAGTALSASTRKRGGGARAAAARAAAEADEGAADVVVIQYTDVVHAALGAVHALLRHAPTVLGAAQRALIDGQVLTLLMLRSSGGLSAPAASCASDARFHVALCRCLEASILSPDPWQKALVPHAVSVFSAGLEHPSVAVRNACAEALANIEPIIHARLPAQLRAPEPEKDYEQECAVPNAILATTATLAKGLDGSAFVDEPTALSAEEVHHQEVEDDEREVEANTKRFKNFTVQP
ncbi:hypothetical protein H4S07_001994, partial [Coemansia furcata]